MQGKFLVGFIWYFLIAFATCKAQQIIRSSFSCLGNSVTETNFRYRHTVGQPSNTMLFSGEDVILRQGFQQPFSSQKSKRLNDLSFEFSFYPNPANKSIEIKSNSINPINHIIIKDAQGRICKMIKEPFLSRKIIEISDLSNGVYFITLKQNNYFSFSQKLVVLK